MPTCAKSKRDAFTNGKIALVPPASGAVAQCGGIPMSSAIRRNILIATAPVGIMLLVKLADLALSPEHVYPGRVAAFPWIELGLTLLAALLGAWLAARTDVVQLWPRAAAGRVFLLALALGAGLGAGLAGLDLALRIGDINVGLPLAPLFYLWGGISQETLSHFAPVAIIVGLVTLLTGSRTAQTVSFSIVAVAMALIAALGMASAFQNPDIPLNQTTPAAPILIGAAVFCVELALFAMFAARGFIAALVMRLGFYAVWHIAWPALAY